MNNGNLTNALDQFEKASVYNNEYGLVFAAIFNLMGFGLAKSDARKAIGYFNRAASEYENNVAQYMMGMIYSEGEEGAEKNFKLTSTWLKKAANNGWTNSALQLAHSHRTGMYGKKDRNKALSFYEKVVRDDNTTSRQIADETPCLFGNLNFEVDLSQIPFKLMESLKKATAIGPISPVLFSKEMQHVSDQEKKLFQQLVFWDTMIIGKKRQYSFAYYGIAALHLGSDNTNPAFSPEKGVYWLEKSAEKGNYIACATLGNIYEQGMVERKSYTKAIEWYLKALELGGGIDLLLNIADICCNRYDMEYDYQLALTCFLTYNESMKESNIDFNIALLYEIGGHGLIQDKSKAKSIYTKLALSGHPEATEKLQTLNKEENQSQRWTIFKS
ncbi:uncharacterized protein EV154DRAFT_506552 [Mucor mucedo]|uniref:uncharacterized protein n=1 Tax=Mucor mucedo TaxID=29922 RepID=UPI00221FC1E2|nr:uncharacterized protein EV154DRAFT_506552 [Mucor mucedo]KAI7891991.1 hypothetical protein EV154DRAFT_506552 [Mucor mucedo]